MPGKQTYFKAMCKKEPSSLFFPEAVEMYFAILEKPSATEHVVHPFAQSIHLNFASALKGLYNGT